MNIIYYLGPKHSFSDIIAKKLFDETSNTFVASNNFDEIVTAVQKDTDVIGILPIENSITSNIHENIDAIFHYDLHIIKEGYLQINLHLLGLPTTKAETITDVYSHPKALKQCSEYIEQHKLIIHELESTSIGKELLLKNNNNHEAIIGSRDLVDEKIVVLAENIANEKMNITRFVCVTSKKEQNTALANKSTIIFNLKNEIGTLARLFTQLAKGNINVRKIDSRPIPGTALEYLFLIDLQQHPINLTLINDIFTTNTTMYKILGVYQEGELFES